MTATTLHIEPVPGLRWSDGENFDVTDDIRRALERIATATDVLRGVTPRGRDIIGDGIGPGRAWLALDIPFIDGDVTELPRGPFWLLIGRDDYEVRCDIHGAQWCWRDRDWRLSVDVEWSGDFIINSEEPTP